MKYLVIAAMTACWMHAQAAPLQNLNLNERIGAIAGAMGRQVGDAVLDTVDFEGSGNYSNRVEVAGSRVLAYASNLAPAAPAPPMVEASFEPGETTLQMRLVGKVRFK
jgi:hypothetical protein